MTYKIKTTSWMLWIPTLVITLGVGVGIGHIFLPKNAAIIFIICLTLFALFVQRFISIAKVEVNLTSDRISIKWLKQYLFHNIPDREFSLSEIKSYKIQPDLNFELFQLTLKDGTKIKLWHWGLTFGDDFAKLSADFPKKVNQYHHKHHQDNRVDDKEEIKIARAKNIFESESAPGLAAFAIFGIITSSLILYFNPPKNPLMIIAPMMGAVFFLTQFYRYRRKKNNGS